MLNSVVEGGEIEERMVRKCLRAREGLERWNEENASEAAATAAAAVAPAAAIGRCRLLHDFFGDDETGCTMMGAYRMTVCGRL